MSLFDLTLATSVNKVCKKTVQLVQFCDRSQLRLKHVAMATYNQLVVSLVWSSVLVLSMCEVDTVVLYLMSHLKLSG